MGFSKSRAALHCSNASRGGFGIPTSQLGAMFFPLNRFVPNVRSVVNVEAGFDTGFALAFANPFGASIGIEIWDGLNATGSLLASASLGSTTDGNVEGLCAAYSSPDYCPFGDFSLAFAGIARSILFTGDASLAVYDDLTFGSTTTGGGTQAPEPGTLALLGLGLFGLGLARRRQPPRALRGEASR